MYRSEDFTIAPDPCPPDLFHPRPARSHAAETEGRVKSRFVAVIDDDDAARQSISSLLECEGYRVLAFASGDAFLNRGPSEPLACALVDYQMPGRNGLDVLRSLSERDDAPPALMLTAHADLLTAVAAMKLKALDVILKPYRPQELLEAIETAVTRREESEAGRIARRRALLLVDRLSSRQRQILAGVVRGRPNKLIAWDLGLSARTVETYRAQMLERLGVGSTAGAVRVAVAAGLDAHEGQPVD